MGGFEWTNRFELILPPLIEREREREREREVVNL